MNRSRMADRMTARNACQWKKHASVAVRAIRQVRAEVRCGTRFGCVLMMDGSAFRESASFSQIEMRIQLAEQTNPNMITGRNRVGVLIHGLMAYAWGAMAQPIEKSMPHMTSRGTKVTSFPSRVSRIR